MATLNLANAPTTLVWRLIRARLEADVLLPGAGIRVVYMDGDPEAIRDLSTMGAPCVRVIPAMGNMAWFDEQSAGGALAVYVEAFLLSPDCEDLFNLQHALETILNSIGDTTFQQDLVGADAITGLILPSQPLVPQRGREGDDTSYRAVGQFTIEVRRPLLPS